MNLQELNLVQHLYQFLVCISVGVSHLTMTQNTLTDAMD